LKAAGQLIEERVRADLAAEAAALDKKHKSMLAVLEEKHEAILQVKKEVHRLLEEAGVDLSESLEKEHKAQTVAVNARGNVVQFKRSLLSKSVFLKVLISNAEQEADTNKFPPFLDLDPSTFRKVIDCMTNKNICVFSPLPNDYVKKYFFDYLGIDYGGLFERKGPKIHDRVKMDCSGELYFGKVAKVNENGTFDALTDNDELIEGLRLSDPKYYSCSSCNEGLVWVLDE
jgi:hypothetical protein